MKYYQTQLFSLAFMLFLSFTACAGWNCETGKEKVSTEKRNLENFNALELNIKAKVNLVFVNESAPKTIEITTHADLIKLISTKVENGVLVISSDPCIDAKDGLTIKLNTAILGDIKINGSGDVFSEKEMVSENLNIVINGSGDINLPVNITNLNVKINGSGDVALNGKSNECTININGSGDFEAPKLEIINANIDINGSGDADVKVKNTLKAKIVGSGDVTFYGKPNTIVPNIIGSGSVQSK